MSQQPDFVSAVRTDLADWRLWLARAVVLVYAAAAGLAVVALTWLSEHALTGFATLRAWQPLAPLVWTPALTALIAWVTLRFAPGAAGSGIPQVMAALSPERRSRAPYIVRLAAPERREDAADRGRAARRPGDRSRGSVGADCRRRHAARASAGCRARSAISHHGLLVAGGAAGIAAAFNAPLAGVMFAIEELTRKLEQRSSGLIIAAIVLAGLMAVSVFGNATYFGVIRVPTLDFDYVLPGVLVVAGCGLLGGFFSRLLHASIVGGPDRLSRWRRKHPVRFAAGCGAGGRRARSRQRRRHLRQRLRATRAACVEGHTRHALALRDPSPCRHVARRLVRRARRHLRAVAGDRRRRRQRRGAR